jgi:hypothetical protein
MSTASDKPLVCIHYDFGWIGPIQWHNSSTMPEHCPATSFILFNLLLTLVVTALGIGFAEAITAIDRWLGKTIDRLEKEKK